MKVVGKNPSIIANEKLKTGSMCTLRCGGRFELIVGYRYHVFFGKTISQKDIAGNDHDSCEESQMSKRMKVDNVVLDQAKAECSQCGTLVVCKYGVQYASERIAAFDLDGTLIETASGKKFANDYTDWKLMFDVKKKLEELYRSRYKVVIFSNQGGIPRGKPSKEDFTKKVASVAQKLGLPLLILAASGQDIYRKPCIGMWDYLLEYENDHMVPDLSCSFYVGDAAGRLADWRKG